MVKCACLTTTVDKYLYVEFFRVLFLSAGNKKSCPWAAYTEGVCKIAALPYFLL